MKKIYLSVPRLALPLLLTTLIHGCAPAGSPADRKKMPEFTSDNGLEGPMPFQSAASSPGPEAFAFHTSNIDLDMGGSLQGFVYVPLPDASNDSLAIALLRSYKLMALPLLNTWAAQQHQGVAIDFSGHNGAPTHRTDYILEKDGGFSIPVVVIWDEASAPRLTQLKALTAELPGITLNTISR
ncbi:MAG TPA: hypothetical protein VGN00_19225 [Puia sp.]|jgi:hypothetical protein